MLGLTMRIVMLLAMLQTFLASSAFAITPRMVTGAIDFRFARNAVALPAPARERLYAKLLELKSAGLCVLEYVVIVGHGDGPSGTGHSGRIGAERAEYVRTLVLKAGIPPHAVHVESPSKGATSLSLGLVELDIRGYWNEPGCELR